MKNKILIIAGIGAFLLLGGSEILSGGASGSGGKKATAITGFIDNPSQPETPTTPENPISKKEVVEPTTPFQPSEYLLNLINERYTNNPPAVTPKQAAYEKGTQKMFNDFGYPEMVKISGGYGYDQQQVYVSKKDVGVAGASSKVIVAPQSYVDRVFDASQKTSTNFDLSGIAAPQDYVDRVSVPVSKKDSSSYNGFNFGGNRYAKNTFAVKNGVMVNTAISGSYRQPDGTWVRV